MVIKQEIEVEALDRIQTTYNLPDSLVNEIRNGQVENIPEEIIKRSFIILFSYYGDQLGPYFRFLFNILRFLDDHNRNHGIDPSSYIPFVQAHVSYSEMLLLFYDMQLFPKMKELVQKYDIIENLPKELLLSKDHEKLYAHPFKSFSELY